MPKGDNPPQVPPHAVEALPYGLVLCRLTVDGRGFEGSGLTERQALLRAWARVREDERR